MGDEDVFWVTPKTINLFTVPVVIVLVGSESALQEDLETIRKLEGTMYTPYGTNDPCNFYGVISLGDQASWATQTMPKEGDRLQVKSGFEFIGKGNVEYYKPGDFGKVIKASDDKVFIRWERTDLTTSMGKYGWARNYLIVPDVRSDSEESLQDKSELEQQTEDR